MKILPKSGEHRYIDLSRHPCTTGCDAAIDFCCYICLQPMSADQIPEAKNEAVVDSSEHVAKKAKLDDGTPVSDGRVSRRDKNKT